MGLIVLRMLVSRRRRLGFLQLSLFETRWSHVRTAASPRFLSERVGDPRLKW